jgi:hypothetical protein
MSPKKWSRFLASTGCITLLGTISFIDTRRATGSRLRYRRNCETMGASMRDFRYRHFCLNLLQPTTERAIEV